jgi:adenosylmethionine-8-amino-7-oxononanoate aminotransferase
MLIMWEEKSDTMRSRMVSYFIYLAMYFNLMPPYWITENKLDWVYQQIDRVLEKVTDRS